MACMTFRSLLGCVGLMIPVSGALAPPVYGQLPPRLELREVQRLDAEREGFPAFRLDRRGNQPFYVGPHREIVVPFQQDMQVRVYDSTARLIKSIGRRGSGPGEFRDFFRLGWVRDTLWVYDAGQRRITFFGPDLDLARTTVLSEQLRQPTDGPNPNVIADFAPSAVRADGSIVGQVLVVSGREPDGWLKYQYFAAVVSPGGNVTRRIAQIPSTAVTTPVRVPTDGTGRFAFATVPFATDAMYAFATSGDRFAIATTERDDRMLSVVAVAASGDTVLRVRQPYRPRRVSAREADSAVMAATRSTRNPPAVTDQLRRLVRAAMPSTHPPVRSVIVARDHRVWVRLSSGGATDTTMVFDATGRAMASVVLPSNVELVEADRDRVWALELDDDGLGSIVVYDMGRRDVPRGSEARPVIASRLLR